MESIIPFENIKVEHEEEIVITHVKIKTEALKRTETSVTSEIIQIQPAKVNNLITIKTFKTETKGIMEPFFSSETNGTETKFKSDNPPVQIKTESVEVTQITKSYIPPEIEIIDLDSDMEDTVDEAASMSNKSIPPEVEILSIDFFEEGLLDTKQLTEEVHLMHPSSQIKQEYSETENSGLLLHPITIEDKDTKVKSIKKEKKQEGYEQQFLFQPISHTDKPVTYNCPESEPEISKDMNVGSQEFPQPIAIHLERVREQRRSHVTSLTEESKSKGHKRKNSQCEDEEDASPRMTKRLDPMTPEAGNLYKRHEDWKCTDLTEYIRMLQYQGKHEQAIVACGKLLEKLSTTTSEEKKIEVLRVKTVSLRQLGKLEDEVLIWEEIYFKHKLKFGNNYDALLILKELSLATVELESQGRPEAWSRFIFRMKHMLQNTDKTFIKNVMLHLLSLKKKFNPKKLVEICDFLLYNFDYENCIMDKINILLQKSDILYKNSQFHCSRAVHMNINLKLIDYVIENCKIFSHLFVMACKYKDRGNPTALWRWTDFIKYQSMLPNVDHNVTYNIINEITKQQNPMYKTDIFNVIEIIHTGVLYNWEPDNPIIFQILKQIGQFWVNHGDLEKAWNIYHQICQLYNIQAVPSSSQNSYLHNFFQVSP